MLRDKMKEMLAIRVKRRMLLPVDGFMNLAMGQDPYWRGHREGTKWSITAYIFKGGN